MNERVNCLTAAQSLADDEDWTRFLELTGKEQYMARIQEWSKLTSETQNELGLDTSGFFTSSIIVVE